MKKPLTTQDALEKARQYILKKTDFDTREDNQTDVEYIDFLAKELVHFRTETLRLLAALENVKESTYGVIKKIYKTLT